MDGCKSSKCWYFALAFAMVLLNLAPHSWLTADKGRNLEYLSILKYPSILKHFEAGAKLLMRIHYQKLDLVLGMLYLNSELVPSSIFYLIVHRRCIMDMSLHVRQKHLLVMQLAFSPVTAVLLSAFQMCTQVFPTELGICSPAEIVIKHLNLLLF